MFCIRQCTKLYELACSLCSDVCYDRVLVAKLKSCCRLDGQLEDLFYSECLTTLPESRPIPGTICSEIPKTCANSNKKAEQQPTTTTTPKKESCCKEKRTLQFPAHLCPFRLPTWEKHEKRVLQINNQLLRQQQQQQLK